MTAALNMFTELLHDEPVTDFGCEFRRCNVRDTSLVVVASRRRSVVPDQSQYIIVIRLRLQWNINPLLVDLRFAAVLPLTSDPEKTVQ